MPNKKITVPIIITALFAAILLPVIIGGQSALKRADSELASENFAEASASYQQAARQLFWREDLWEKAGIAAAKNGNWAEAIELFERGPTLSEEGWIWLGTSHLYSGKTDLAIAAFKEGLQTFASPKLHGLLALAYRKQKNWTAERDELEAQLFLTPEDVHARYRLGLLLSILDPERALTDLMLASSLNPEFDPAVQTLRTALNLSATQPDESQQMVTIGRALGLVTEWELSIAAFEKAISMDAENAEAWAWLGEAKQQTGGILSESKDQDGIVELDRALLLDHTSITVRALRGLYWRRREKYPQMLAEYLLAAEYDPANPTWQAEIGNAHFKLGDLASALTAFQRATELAPNDSTYWRLLAVFCAENSVYLEDVGLPAAQKAVDLAPDDPRTLDVLGWAYFASGKFANAEEVLLDVTERFPEYLPAHIHLAMNYLSQDNRDAAYEKLIYVRQVDPNGEDGAMAGRLLEQYFP